MSDEKREYVTLPREMVDRLMEAALPLRVGFASKALPEASRPYSSTIDTLRAENARIHEEIETARADFIEARAREEKETDRLRAKVDALMKATEGCTDAVRVHALPVGEAWAIPNLSFTLLRSARALPT